MGQRLRAILNLREGELGPCAWGAAQFFCILSAYFLVRPVREAMGVERGIWQLYWLWYATLGVTLAANWVLGAVVTRLPRRVFVPVVYRFFTVCLLGFVGVLLFAPWVIGAQVGRVFYVWTSVFSMFVVAMFWAQMAERFSLAQAKRVFPVIAIGGTTGAIVGAAGAAGLGRVLDAYGHGAASAPALMISSAVLLEGGVWCAGAMLRRTKEHAHGHTERIGGTSWDAVATVAGSRYLLAASGYIWMLALGMTLIYFTQAQVVIEAAEETSTRIWLFAQIDLLTQVATLILQALVTGRLIRWIGVGRTLAIQPILLVAGFVALALWPVYGVMALFTAVFSASRHAIARPARETLFTVIDPDDKWKAKPFIDTFVYRAGDVAGLEANRGLTTLALRFGVGIAPLLVAAIALGAGWAALGVYLGIAQRSRAGAPGDDGGTLGA